VRRQLSNSIALGFVLAASFCSSARAGVSVPDWVRQAAAQPLGNYPLETKAVVLLNATDYKVMAPGEYVEHSRHVVKILRPDGRKYGEAAVSLRTDEKILSLHAWSIDSAGHQYELREKDFLERGEFDFELYSDYLMRIAAIPANQPGTVVGFEYEVRRHEWINELGWIFQDQVPVVESVLTVQLPVGWEYRTAWAVGSPVQPVLVGENRWEWRIHGVPGIEEDKEFMMPPFLSVAGRMSVSYFAPGQTVATAGSWREVGQWYEGLTRGRPNPSPEISAKVSQLIAGKPDFGSRLQVLTSFLQAEIRYVAISVGIGGNQPHPASDVFRYRYGDCKDKVTLLKSMLQDAGIHSSYVLIDTRRGFINPAVPSSWGDHAIIAIKIPDGVPSDRYRSVVTTKSGQRYLIFDPTDEYTPVGSLRSELQDSYALLVADSGGELIRTPLLPPDWNTTTRTGHFVLTADGGLSGDVSEDRSGDSAMHERERLHHTDQRERTNDFERWLGRSIQGFTLESMKIEQADQLMKDLLISYKFTTSQYGQSRGPLMLVRSRVLDDKSSYVERKPRHYPVELERTMRETDTYEIEIPKEYQVDDVPDPVNIDVGFASYQSKIEVEGSKLTYWREYVVRDLSVPPEKFADWARLQGVIGADEAAAVVLKRAP
jgi:Domain of Unknown Function with PDB structure (DUF3857)